MPQTTDQLIERIEQEFDLDDIDQTGDSVYNWLSRGKMGSHRIKNGYDRSGKQRYAASTGLSFEGRSKIRNLAAQIGDSKRIYNAAGKANSVENLEDLKSESRGLIFRRKEVVNFIDMRKQELQLSLNAQIEVETQEAESEIETLNEEIQGLEESRIAAAEESPKEAERFELTIEEREDARRRLQDKIKELTKRRGK